MVARPGLASCVRTVGIATRRKMKLSLSLSALLLVAAVNAAPKSPEVVKAPEGSKDVHADLPRTSWPLLTNHNNLTVPGTLGSVGGSSSSDKWENEYLDDNDYGQDNDYGEDVSGAFDSDIDESYRDIQRRLREDNYRLQHDLLLIRRLLGLLPYADRPGTTSFALWGFPSFGFTSNDSDSNVTTSENGTDLIVPDDDFDFPNFGIRFDLPIFPNLSDLPMPPNFPNVDDLPDNYDNSTHEVHDVNGTRIEVNTTTNKESGDGFKTFFHTKVIAMRPEDDQRNTTQTEEGTDVKHPTKEEGKPTLPEVENEAVNSGVTRLPVPHPETEVKPNTTAGTGGIFL